MSDQSQTRQLSTQSVMDILKLFGVDKNEKSLSRIVIIFCHLSSVVHTQHSRLGLLHCHSSCFHFTVLVIQFNSGAWKIITCSAEPLGQW